MSHAPVEIVEEDAADLQFPKGKKAFAEFFPFQSNTYYCVYVCTQYKSTTFL